LSDSSVQPEVMLVLCHSFFHDAFRPHEPVTSRVYNLWLSSHFVANFIIERQAELPEGSHFAVTSKQVFDDFAFKFHGDKPSFRQKETVEILHSSIFVIDHPSIAALPIDESVFVICDVLYSLSKFELILISNIPKKKEKAEAFYHKKDPMVKMPYPIDDAIQVEHFLRGRYPELCKLVDERMAQKNIKK